MAHISIVSPVYMAENILPELVERITKSVKQITDDFEIILVEDGSSDQSWAVIEHLANEYQFIKGLKLSRNFGQHYAITAGLDHANADWVVVMDCDLQDMPEEIIKFYKKAQDGYDIVVGKRVKRQDGHFKIITSKLFHKTFNYLADLRVNSEISSFGIYSRQVIENCSKFREEFQVFGMKVYWMGFRCAEICIKHQVRQTGRSGYGFIKRIKLAANLILSYTDKPLRIMFGLGLIIAVSAFCFASYFVLDFFISNKQVSGWTSLIVSLFFIGGLLLSGIGLVGVYIGKIFQQVKNRPLYIIKDSLNI